MYERFYGLKERPFSLTPDPDFVFMGKDFKEALERLIYGIRRREGFTVIVGDVGTGKTMLCWTLLGRLDRSVRTALVLNPLLNEEEILKAILEDFGVRPRKSPADSGPEAAAAEAAPYDPSWMGGLSRKELLDALNRFLLEGAPDDVANVLVIDEAQNLSLEVLEQLRILSNMETPKQKLLQIIFVGQLEFEQKLGNVRLRQLNQRITVRCRLRPLGRKDTVQYIYHRLVVAGGSRNISFTDGALRSIYRFSSGYPRLINVMCDAALLAAYSERTRTVTGKIVRKAARGLRQKRNGKRSNGVRVIAPVRWAIPLTVLAVVLLIALLVLWNPGRRISRIFAWPDRSANAASSVQAAGEVIPEAAPVKVAIALESEPAPAPPSSTAEMLKQREGPSSIPR